MRILTGLIAGVFLASCGAAQTDEPAKPKDVPKVQAPDAGSQDYPVDFRRASLIVHDIDESLKFYRDILGFKVNYDARVTMSGKALPAGEPGAQARLVLISSNDSWVGWIGLLQWIDPPLERPEKRTRMGIGDALLVFNTEKVDEHCDAAAKLSSITMTEAAGNTTYPGRDGGPDIVVRTCYLFDADGYFVELNQVLDREAYNAK